ncbi:DUF992 domain-containing protein [Neoroseomonas oryzicola]|uniref:DUF992 domain-containing protein n=1 Tax=Neoroseomonas oryzicola TaxID=535904 RepID=A0A9X9WQ78_9PROT|nr:DUF992 domain-containing protein [Neoroseomonas oryzicola]MBR0662488.1 DUF992 domain-containing protein [Neoroseomonas oryzicola]NKE19369.1 DUF992 domain-containing protein [Neoroseomonas oryzicola]
MRQSRIAIAALLGLAAAVPAMAQTQQPQPQQTGHVRAGTLRCDVAAGTSFVFGSTREVTCVYTPTRGAAERYTGEIKRYGVDVGYTSSAVMLWGVLASTGDLGRGALAGGYAGVSAGATAGVGAGANLLVGGSNRGVSLQPLSVEGNTGLNIALGVAELTLTAAR